MAKAPETGSRRKKWQDPLRLVLLREETLEEIGSYRLSLLNVYLLVSSVILVVAAIIVSVIFFTPVKQLVPGYADIENNRVYTRLYNRVEDLEKALEAQKLYTDNFRAMLMQQSDSTVTAREEGTIADVQEQETPPNTPPMEVAKPDPDRQENRGPVIRQVREESGTPKLEQLYLVPPVRGTVSAGFDASINHYGIDILAPENTPVKAILEGHVIFSDWTLETGNTIGIQHSGSMVSFYKHNSVLLKKHGSHVKAGEAVAVIGNTGNISSGPHLHFELWIDGSPIDPANFVNFQ